MLHYVILLVGFFVALGALGIDLTKVTILAGAFSVGIGFGLQNVINNFVSGLILLFERPIKVGDVIEVGGNLGEVSRIGIRASVIRTADGSEVIVPNGSLISSQVTNWTFSDRTARGRSLHQRGWRRRSSTRGRIVEKYCRCSSWCSKRTVAAGLRNQLQRRCGNLSTSSLDGSP